MFDDPRAIAELARDHAVGLNDLTLFYYEEHDQEFDEQEKEWRDLEPPKSPVMHPMAASLRGYDVVTFSRGSGPECSPLSCNGLAATITTNPHCLLDTLERAKASLEQGLFEASEPGPMRIFAIYTVMTSAWTAAPNDEA